MTTTLTIADLPNTGPTPFAWVATRPEMDEIAQALDLVGLRKMRLEGEIRPSGNSDWTLTAGLGATVVQPCVVTLEPVTTRIDEAITRSYLAHWSEPEDAEVELESGEDSEALPDILDLAALAQEALSLTLPVAPRSTGSENFEANFAPDGVDPLTDDSAKPFAGLADLKKKLESGS